MDIPSIDGLRQDQNRMRTSMVDHNELWRQVKLTEEANQALPKTNLSVPVSTAELRGLLEENERLQTQLETARKGLEYLHNNDVRYNTYELKRKAWEIWKSIE